MDTTAVRGQTSAVGGSATDARPNVVDRLAAARPRSEWVIAAVAMVVAWFTRFVQDDAYISFRYAHNLAEGRGLVYNVGDRVEGYTNFLWTLILWIPEKLGWDPVLFSQLVSIVLLGCTVLVAFRLADRVLGRSTVSMGAVLFLVGTVTFLGYGTGGLETMLQTLLIAGVSVLALRAIGEGVSPGLGGLLGISALGGLAVLTRLDSAVLVGFWMVAVVWSVVRAKPGAKGLARSLAALAGPALVAVVPWMIWKVAYYGEIVPNTFVAKGNSPVRSIATGIAYIGMFALSYGLVLLVPAAFRFRSELWRTKPLRLTLGALSLWSLYLVWVGGDFMEFRFMVPVLPLLFCIVALVVSLIGRRWRTIFIGVFCVLSLLHLSWFPYPRMVANFHVLNEQVASGDGDWSMIGRRLGELFPGGMDRKDQVLIGIGPAGAIAYDSDLPAIDMLGLTDAWVARHGEVLPDKPGHVRHAPMSYLVDRHVNLVVGRAPLIVDSGKHSSYSFDDVATFVDGRMTLHKRSQIPPSAQVLEIPFATGKALAVLYLTPNPAVERYIRDEGWRLVPID